MRSETIGMSAESVEKLRKDESSLISFAESRGWKLANHIKEEKRSSKKTPFGSRLTFETRATSTKDKGSLCNDWVYRRH
jgi:hypothetical protein